MNTDLGRFAPLPLRLLSWPLRLFLLRTPQAGADGVVWLAASEDEGAKSSGRYWYDRKEITSSEASRDAAAAAALWATIEAQAPA